MSDTARTVLAGLGSVRSDLEDLYQDLHRHPELGLREHRTAKKAAESLRRSGYDVTEGVGGTGVIGVLANGDGPVVMARADMDALPVRERTGLPYASTATVTDEDGREQPVMHACGHDVHVTSLVGCARLLAGHRDDWRGTFVALFQPSEENAPRPRHGRGRSHRQIAPPRRRPRPARTAVPRRVRRHPLGVLPVRRGQSPGHRARPGRARFGAPGVGRPRGDRRIGRRTAADRRLPRAGRHHARRGDRGQHPRRQRPQRHPRPGRPGAHVRTYDDATRTQVLDAIKRIVRAECEASRSPREPEFERLSTFPPTVNDEEPTRRVAEAFGVYFGDDAHTVELQTASEDMSEIPGAFGVPFTYWAIGGTDPDRYAEAPARDRRPGHPGQPQRRLRPRRPADPGHGRERADGGRAGLARRRRPGRLGTGQVRTA